MSDKGRWSYGDTNPMLAAVDSATVIEIDDLVFQDTDDAKPASAANWSVEGDHPKAPTLQELFADNFFGVAMQRSRSGDTDPILVATTGVFEFDCPSGTFELGDLMGAHFIDAPLSLESEPQDRAIQCLANQQVAPVNDAKRAIARVAKRVAMPADSVLVDIRSKIMGHSL